MSDKELQSFLKNLKNKKEIFLLLIPIVLGLYLRAQTLNWHRLWAYDPYFYYRQAVYFANGGSIHDVDTLIVTTIRRFSDNEYFLPLLWAYLGKIFHIDLWTLGIYLPLIIFVFQIIVVYKIGKDAFNWKVGFFASLFLSVMGAHVYRTHAGGIWKDTLGSLFMLMFLHAVILILKERELDIRKAILYGAYLTLSLYLSIITFDGFGEFSLVVSIYLILSPLISKPRKNEFFIATLMIPALLLGGMSVGTYWPWSDYRLKEIYLFIPFLMASIFALISLAVGVFVLNFVRHERKGKIIYILVLASVFLGLLYFFWKFHQNPDKNSLWYPIYRFVNYLLKPEITGLSAQSRPTTFDVLWLFFSVLLAFVILGGIVSGYYVVNSPTKGQKRLNLLFLILFATGTFLGIATIRLTYLMSFGVAFSSAIFFDYLAKVLQFKLPDKNKLVAVLLMILLITTVPTFMNAKQYASMPPTPNDSWLDAVQWMGNNIKGQVVLNWWDWGHWIQAFGVKTTSDNIYQRGNEYAWFVRVNEEESAKLIKRTQDLARANTGKNITINYIVIGRDLLLKLGTLNRYYPPAKKIEVYPFRLERALGNTRIYSMPNAKIIIIVKFEKNSTKAALIYGNVKRELKNIVVEIPSKQNLVFNYGPDEYITYVTPFACFLIPSELEDTMLVKLLIFEQSEKYKRVYDNGYVKIYKISKV